MGTVPPTPPVRESPPPDIEVVCPHCQTRLAIHPSYAGTATACPKCGGKFQVPLPTAHSDQGPHSPHHAAPEYRAFVSKKVAAGILGILLGCLGIHKFILGLNTAGVIMLVVSLLGGLAGCFVVPLLGPAIMAIIGLAEGIIYLTKSDEDFYQTYAVEKREWF